MLHLNLRFFSRMFENNSCFKFVLFTQQRHHSEILKTERDIQVGCYAVLFHLQRLIWDNTYMIHILPNLYCVQYFSTVPFDGSSNTVLVGNYRTPYQNNRYCTVMFPGFPKASKLHNLSIYWNHQLAYLFSIISCWILTKLPTMWVYSSCHCVCVVVDIRVKSIVKSQCVWILYDFCRILYCTVQYVTSVLYTPVQGCVLLTPWGIRGT